MPSKYDMIAVIGPTASGKTTFAAHLAKRLNGEIISADSRQIYRRMNLGTGKDYESYVVDGFTVPVHMVDIADPGYKYSIYEYRRDFFDAYDDIRSRGKLPVLCGGSGMYIDAVTRNYRLEEVPVNDRLRREMSGKSLGELHDILRQLKSLHNTTDVDTVEHALRALEIEYHYRQNPVKETWPVPSTLFLGVMYEREAERERITQRLKERLQQGMIEEVRQLLESGLSAESLVYYGLEYRFITQHLQGEMDYHTMFTRLNTAIHQFSKRQRTWFRKMEKGGTVIHWINGELPLNEKVEIAVALT